MRCLPQVTEDLSAVRLQTNALHISSLARESILMKTYTGQNAGHVQHTVALQRQRSIAVGGGRGIVADSLSASNCIVGA